MNFIHLHDCPNYETGHKSDSSLILYQKKIILPKVILLKKNWPIQYLTTTDSDIYPCCLLEYIFWCRVQPWFWFMTKMWLEKLKNNIEHGGERSQKLAKQMSYENKKPEKSQNRQSLNKRAGDGALVFEVCTLEIGIVGPRIFLGPHVCQIFF